MMNIISSSTIVPSWVCSWKLSINVGFGCTISYAGSTISCQSGPADSSRTPVWRSDNIKDVIVMINFCSIALFWSMTNCFARYATWKMVRQRVRMIIATRIGCPATCNVTENASFCQPEHQDTSCDKIKRFLAGKAWNCQVTSLDSDARRDEAWESVSSHVPIDFVISTRKKLARTETVTPVSLHSAHAGRCHPKKNSMLHRQQYNYP